MPAAADYADVAQASWRWVLNQVKSGPDGLWLGEHPDQTDPTDGSYGMHSGVGGLAHALAEIRLAREWTIEEHDLAEGIAQTLVARIPATTEYDFFDGLTSTVGILLALDSPGADLAVARLLDLATPTGWPATWLEPRAVAEGRCNDATLGTASVLLGALWALRRGVPGATDLAHHAVNVLLAEREPNGYWPFLPLRFLRQPDLRMPNWSHGQAGIVASLTAAGMALDRPDLLAVAIRGTESLLELGDTSDGGLRLPHYLPDRTNTDTFTYSWCHGPTGTSLLFAALDRAGVPTVDGRPPQEWERACLHSLRASGIPARLRPGFWDNDGRCCGTAGVGDVVLSAWQRGGRNEDLDFAVTLGDALLERAIRDEENAVYWRFLEHRNADPLLPPGPGWMQGAAGIAAYLFRLARVLEQGRDAPAVARMETWWALRWPGRALS